MEEMINVSRKEYERMKSQIAKLTLLVKRLMDEIALLRNGHNSKTGSTASSQDIGRSNKITLRGKSDRKLGGQEGHAGHTLVMQEQADEIIEHVPNFCEGCGQSPDAVSGEIATRRQAVEIPAVKSRYIEHQRIVKTCPCCGQTNYQYFPYKRSGRLFSDLFHLPLSDGSIDTVLERMSQKSDVACREIQDHIAESEVVGADETGCHVNGKKHWFHVWQTKFLTFIVSFKSRGHQVTDEYFPGSFFCII